LNKENFVAVESQAVQETETEKVEEGKEEAGSDEMSASLLKDSGKEFQRCGAA